MIFNHCPSDDAVSQKFINLGFLELMGSSLPELENLDLVWEIYIIDLFCFRHHPYPHQAARRIEGIL